MSAFRYVFHEDTENVLGQPCPKPAVGEGLLAEQSVSIKETRSEDDVTHAWQLWTMTDEGRLLTDGTNYAQ